MKIYMVYLFHRATIKELGEIVSYFKSWNAEAVGARWSAKKRNREQIGIWQAERMSRMMGMLSMCVC